MTLFRHADPDYASLGRLLVCANFSLGRVMRTRPSLGPAPQHEFTSNPPT